MNPTGNGAVTITLPETTDCNATGAICTDDEQKTVPFHIGDSGRATRHIRQRCHRAGGGGSSPGVFTASLSHASSRIVTVDYATSDGTAQAGSDYTAASGDPHLQCR